MFKTLKAAVCVAALGMALPPVVCAQRNAPEPASVRRPYRGIFGGPSDPSAPQSLNLTASVYGAYDDNILAGLSEAQARNSWLQRSGTYWGSQLGIDYSLLKPGERVSFGAHSGAQLQYRDAAGSYLTPYYNGELNVDIKMTKSTTLRATESVSYAPNYSAILMPAAGGAEIIGDIAVMPDPDLELFPMQTLRTGSRLGLSQRFGRNTTLSGAYSFRTVDIDETQVREGQRSAFQDYHAHTGSASLSHSRPVTSHATMVLGYGVRVTERDSVSAEPRVMHHVNAGVDYSRALSFSRRTSLSFSSGSAITVSENLQVPGAGSRTRAHLIGNANLNHEMGRTWTARLSYARGLVSRDGFGELYFTDSVSGTVDGLVSRRLSFSGIGSWSVSSLDRSGGNQHNGLSATAQGTYALAQYLGLYARLVYYRYEYGDDIPLDPRLARGLERKGIRVGLTTSIPLIR